MINSRVSFLAFAAFTLALPIAPAPAVPAGDAAAGRELAHRFADAIVSVEATARVAIAIGAQATTAREGRFEANGTVISPAGLTVTSLSEIDPRGAAEAAVHHLTVPGGKPVNVAETQFSDVKIRLADGTRLPARIVRMDRDRDLVFVAPTAAGDRKFACLKLDDAAEPALLGSYFVLSRAPESLQNVAEIHAATINGIVEKPHRAFIPSGSVAGCPMLDPAGRVIGLCLAQIVEGRPNLVNGHANSIVLAASEVADAARALQAPAIAFSPR